MAETYTVTGTLTNAHTLTLDEALPLAPTRARVVVEPLAGGAPRPYGEVVAAIRARQRQRGHQPRSRAAVDAALLEELASWDG
jgi:hypothetical protein